MPPESQQQRQQPERHPTRCGLLDSLDMRHVAGGRYWCAAPAGLTVSRGSPTPFGSARRFARLGVFSLFFFFSPLRGVPLLGRQGATDEAMIA